MIDFRPMNDKPTSMNRNYLRAAFWGNQRVNTYRNPEIYPPNTVVFCSAIFGPTLVENLNFLQFFRLVYPLPPERLGPLSYSKHDDDDRNFSDGGRT